MRVGDTDAMNEYIIGAGAVLTAGDDAKITPATLHAEVSAGVAGIAKAVAVDFEGTSEERLRRLLLVGSGWNRKRFDTGVTAGLMASRACSFADVLAALAEAAGEGEVHLFAHWLPLAATTADLQARNVRLVVHPLESIERAALIEDQAFRRWEGRPLTRAA